MRTGILRTTLRAAAFATGSAATVCLALALYCAWGTLSYHAASESISGTIVAVEKPAFERDEAGFRPVVEVDLPGGATETHRFTGLYRVPEDAVGQSYALLYNPHADAATVVPNSPLNWIGSYVYGAAFLALLLTCTILHRTTRRQPHTNHGAP